VFVEMVGELHAAGLTGDDVLADDPESVGRACTAWSRC
jgi:hypothetical protein